MYITVLVLVEVLLHDTTVSAITNEEVIRTGTLQRTSSPMLCMDVYVLAVVPSVLHLRGSVYTVGTVVLAGVV